MKITCLLAIVLLAQGCASLTEEELERREYRRVDRTNLFLEFKANCKYAGGRVHIYRWGTGSPRNKLPNPGDMYSCLDASRRRP